MLFCLSTATFFQGGLIFAGKAGAYPNRAPHAPSLFKSRLLDIHIYATVVECLRTGRGIEIVKNLYTLHTHMYVIMYTHFVYYIFISLNIYKCSV